MTFGDILAQIAEKDLAGGKKLSIQYQESFKDGKFRIRLWSQTDPDAYIHTSVPDDGTEECQNYARAYILSMVFNAGIHGVKRGKKENKIKPSN